MLEGSMLFDKVLDKIKNNKYLKRFFIPVIISGAVAGGVVGGLNDKPQQTKKNVKIKPKIENVAKADTVTDPILEIKFRTDTLDKPRGGTLLYYLRGGITRYFVDNNDSYRLQLPYFCHEKWHEHNDKLKVNIHYLTPLECYKLKMHDEISANMCEVLTVRYEYLFANNKKAVLDKYSKKHLAFYTDAIKKGIIHPEDNSPAAREKEWKFIANGTRDMWMETFSKQYSANTYLRMCLYLQWMGVSNSKNDNYSILANKIYTIGGVNFFALMDHDIEVHDDVVTLKNRIGQISSFSEKNRTLVDHVNTDYSLLDKVPEDKQLEAIQHLLIAARLKYMLRDINVEELKNKPNTITACYENILAKVHLDMTFVDFVRRYSLIGHKPNPQKKTEDSTYKKIVSKMYEYKGVDLTTLINGFSEKYVPVAAYSSFLLNTNIVKMNNLSNINSASSFWNRDPFVSQFTLNAELDNMRKISKQKPEKKPAGTTEKTVDRFSDTLYMRVPNFFQPILEHATAEQLQEIREIYEDFASIPSEFIHCNVQQQRKYLEKNPDYIEPYRIPNSVRKQRSK